MVVGFVTYQRHDPVADTPSDDAPGTAFGADIEGEDLGWVESGRGEPGGAKGGGV